MKYRDLIKLSQAQKEIYWQQAQKKFREQNKKETAKRTTA